MRTTYSQYLVRMLLVFSIAYLAFLPFAPEGKRKLAFYCVACAYVGAALAFPVRCLLHGGSEDE